MAPRPSYRRGRLSSGPVLLAGFALGAALLTVGVMWAAGILDLGEDFEQPPGTVAVPMSPTNLPAYTRITRDDLIDPRTGRLAFLYMQPEEVPERALASLGEVIGRVLRRDKAPGYVFSEADFMPRGTRAGLSAGVPPGKRAMRVEVGRIAGLVGLGSGERFDLLGSIQVDPSGMLDPTATGLVASQATLDPGVTTWKRQARVTVLVQNGVVVAPMTTRNVPVSIQTITQVPITRTRPVQEVVIAIAPEEVAPLAEALAVGADIQTVLRSGHPDDPVDSVTPSSRPRSAFEFLAGSRRGSPDSGEGYALVESIDGAGRRYLALPPPSGPGGSLVADLPPSPAVTAAPATESPFAEEIELPSSTAEPAPTTSPSLTAESRSSPGVPAPPSAVPEPAPAIDRRQPPAVSAPPPGWSERP